MTARGWSTARPRGELFRRFVDTGAPIALLVAVYIVIDRFVRGGADLGADGYREPILLVELARQHRPIAAAAGLTVALSIWRTRGFGPDWPGFDRGWSLRVPVGVIVAVLSWTYACYDYNLWVDRLHALDRMALIALAIAALWRPVFLVPWTVVVSMLAFQFRHPIGVDQLAETFQLVRIVELFVAVVLIRLAMSRWLRSEFVLATVALVASAYWVSGLGKLRLGWFSVGPHLDSLFFATHGNGWLGSLSAGSAAAVGRSMGPLLWPMLLVGTVVELGAVAILWGRRPLRFWLFAFVAFHLGVAALTGIFFWKWIVFELALLAFLRHDRLIDQLPIFDLPHAVIATALIVAGPFWARPVDLSWLDSPVNYVYRFDATMSDGEHRQLSPEFFRPHDYLFTLSPFGYLSSEPQLPIVWGAIRDRDQLEALYAADGPEPILELESSVGTIEYDAARAEMLDAFLRDVATNWNRRHSHSSGFSVIGPPPQLLTWGSDPGDADIERITVWQVTTYWDGTDFAEIRVVNEREVEIASP